MRIETSDRNMAAVTELAKGLIGTRYDLDTAIQDAFGGDADQSIMDADLLARIDETAELCWLCGWWEEPALMDDGRCSDCIGQEDDE